MPYVNVNSVRLYYELHGDGFPLVLLHGGEGNSGSWHKQTPVFSGSFKVLLVDERGFGHSSAPPCDYDRFTIARDILGLLEALGMRRVFLLGYSMGGATALRTALLAPQRIAALLVSGCGATWRVSDGFRQRLIQALTWAEAEGCGALFERLFAASVFSETFHAQHPEEVRRYRDICDQNSATAWVMRMREDLSLTPGDITARLHEIRMPTRLLCGEHDYNRPRVESVHQRLPAADLHVFPGAAHGAFYEQPERFNDLALEFFLSHLPGVS